MGVFRRTDLLAAERINQKSWMALKSLAGVRRRQVGGLLHDRLPQAVMHLLRTTGEFAERRGVSIYVVGGFVRDLLLGIDSLDIDLVVEGDGIAFARALAKDKGGRVTAHERFGTAVLQLPEGFKLDVATARTEYYEYPTALPTVQQCSIKKDLHRRDFTINALAVGLNPRMFGRLIDFYGGQRDLKARVIRVLHSLSFVEDPTRVFRAIRFELRFGFHLGQETLALIKGAVKMELFPRLSGRRLLNELRYLFSERTPRHAVRRLADFDLLRSIHPTLSWSSRLNRRLIEIEERLVWHKIFCVDQTISPWLLYVMTLAEALPEPAVQEVLERFPFTESERTDITAARFAAQHVCRQLSRRPPLRPSETVRLLTGLSDEFLVFLLSKNTSASAKREISAYLTTYRTVRPVLKGKQLKVLGFTPGPQYSAILARLTEARLDGSVSSEAEERDLIARLVEENRAG